MIVSRTPLLGALIGLLLLALPTAAQAVSVFGGQASATFPCFNLAIWTTVGAPRGGIYIWTPATKTYPDGPPAPGKYVLGLYGIPYFCIVLLDPLFVLPGISMTLEASSGSGSGAQYSTFNPNNYGGVLGNVTTPAASTGVGTSGSGSTASTANAPTHVLISEVYDRPDAAHGSDAAHEWVELYNPTSASVDLSSWVFQNASLSETIPSGTSIAADGYLLITGTPDLRAVWSIPTSTPIVVFSWGGGFAAAGDEAVLENASGSIVDDVSWGSNTFAFSPAAPVVAVGHSLARQSLTSDTNTASDWIDSSSPTPGQ